MSIYQNQTKLAYTVNIGEDLTDATSAVLKYTKPSGATGQHALTITNASAGTTEYEFGAGDLDEFGIYVFWSYVTFSDGSVVPGDVFTEDVLPEGEGY